jgi:predicted acetyltransferase
MFQFLDPGPLVDGDLELVLHSALLGDEVKGHVPAYQFKMMVRSRSREAGYIELRVAHTEHITCYAGHIGYRVYPHYRGHHYAARACRLLRPLARRHGLDPVWITCDPTNLASRRTCELAGAELIEIVDVPQTDEIYMRGERQKCRYRLEVRAVEARPVPGGAGSGNRARVATA